MPWKQNRKKVTQNDGCNTLKYSLYGFTIKAQLWATIWRFLPTTYSMTSLQSLLKRVQCNDDHWSDVTQMSTIQHIEAKPRPTNKTFQSRLWGEVSSGGSICLQYRKLLRLLLIEIQEVYKWNSAERRLFYFLENEGWEKKKFEPQRRWCRGRFRQQCPAAVN